MNINNKNLFIILILLVAAILRFWGLGRGDTVNDEVFYAFRAIGPLDFDHAEFQTTPLEWLDPVIPNWTKLSFHDHPPLVFWVQHFFLKIFGENNLAFRLPSALLGIGSVFLIYLLGRLLYWRQVGFLAAGIFAVTLNQVYISRTGLQEAYVVFFILLASFLFLKALERDTYFLWLGIALGFAFLTKYTVFILLPIFFVYLLWFRRGLWLNKKLWIGTIFALLIFSPVIIYNIELYRAVGHFDFQVSYILGQNPQVWQAAPGKEIGTLQDRLGQFMPRLIATHSWAFLILFGASIVFFLWGALREPKEIFYPVRSPMRLGRIGSPDVTSGLTSNGVSAHKFLLIAFVFMGLWIIFFIGPSFRFLTMLTPFLVFPVALFFDTLYHYKSPHLSIWHLIPWKVCGRGNHMVGWRGFQKRCGDKFAAPGFVMRKDFKFSSRILFFAGLILFFLFEIAYSYNSQIAYYPMGSTPWFFSKIRYENYNWGYNDLDIFLKKALTGKMPSRVFAMQYEFLEKIRDADLLKAKEAGAKPYPVLIVYYGNFDDGAKLWVLDRLATYHGWPVIKMEDYFGFLQKNGQNYFAKFGFQEYYFIIMNNIESSPEVRVLIKDRIYRGIFNKKGEEVFRIYRLQTI